MTCRTLRCLAAAAAFAALSPAAATSQDEFNYAVSLLGGIGGSSDSRDGGFSNSSYQLAFAFRTDVKTLVGVRYGEVGFGRNDSFGPLFDPDLSYFTVAGEYRFSESYYESGLFLGVGYYDLSGRDLFGSGRDDSGVGLTLGAVGDFSLTRRLSILGELAGHAVNLDRANAFLTGHVGLAVHF